SASRPDSQLATAWLAGNADVVTMTGSMLREASITGGLPAGATASVWAGTTSGGRSFGSINCAGAITVSQWQMFSSWRTLPGKANAASCASAASEMRLG